MISLNYPEEEETKIVTRNKAVATELLTDEAEINAPAKLTAHKPYLKIGTFRFPCINNIMKPKKLEKIKKFPGKEQWKIEAASFVTAKKKSEKNLLKERNIKSRDELVNFIDLKNSNNYCFL